MEIALNNTEKLKIQLIDASGRTIEVRNITAVAGTTIEKFDVSTLAGGLYHLAVSDSKTIRL
ncbi:MAG: hypothetical protein IPP34_08120 [Bacteroidetes bacterium]|nr:hypothetical protein [Bacteroidota bacterium]